MKESESIGKVTVGYGTHVEKEIEIKEFIQCNFPDNRLISIANLVDEEGYVLIVENPESTGRSNQKIWLSYESFMGLLATACLYLSHNKIDIGAEAEKMKGEDIKFSYAKRKQ